MVVTHEAEDEGGEGARGCGEEVRLIHRCNTAHVARKFLAHSSTFKRVPPCVQHRSIYEDRTIRFEVAYSSKRKRTRVSRFRAAGPFPAIFSIFTLATRIPTSRIIYGTPALRIFLHVGSMENGDH